MIKKNSFIKISPKREKKKKQRPPTLEWSCLMAASDVSGGQTVELVFCFVNGLLSVRARLWLIPPVNRGG